MTEELEEPTFDPEDMEPEVKMDHFNFQPANELMRNGKPRELLPGFLLRGSVGLVVAEPHVGKTLTVLDLAIAVATGQSFLGKRSERVLKTAAFFFDSAAWAMKDQYESLIAGRLLSFDAIGDKIVYRARSAGRIMDLNSAVLVGKLIESLQYHDADICVLDCFSNCNSADENSRMEMDGVMGAAAEIAVRAGVAVIITDHPPVAGRLRRSVYQARGSSVKETAADWIWHLDVMPGGNKMMRVLKSRGLRNAGDSYEFALVPRAGGVVLELREVGNIHKGSATKWQRLHKFVLAWMTEPRTVQELVEKVMEEGLARDGTQGEKAVRNALTQLKHRGCIERVMKNTWAKVEVAAE